MSLLDDFDGDQVEAEMDEPVCYRQCLLLYLFHSDSSFAINFNL